MKEITFNTITDMMSNGSSDESIRLSILECMRRTLFLCGISESNPYDCYIPLDWDGSGDMPTVVGLYELGGTGFIYISFDSGDDDISFDSLTTYDQYLILEYVINNVD